MRPSELQFSRQGGFFYTSPDEVTAGTGDVEAPYRTGVDQADTWRIIGWSVASSHAFRRRSHGRSGLEDTRVGSAD